LGIQEWGLNNVGFSEVEMGYKVKIQKGQRPTNRAFKVVMPTAIAEAIKMEKGEDFE